jgi:hypothetical protein
LFPTLAQVQQQALVGRHIQVQHKALVGRHIRLQHKAFVDKNVKKDSKTGPMMEAEPIFENV